MSGKIRPVRASGFSGAGNGSDGGVDGCYVIAELDLEIGEMSAVVGEGEVKVV